MPTPVRVVANNDGPQITVNDMMKDPLFIPALILSDIDQLFVAQDILRPAGGGTGNAGAVVYYESTPLYSDTASEFVEEYAEIPVAMASRGIPKAVRARRKGLGVVVSQDMRDDNDVDAVNIQIQQVRNTFVRDFDTLFINAAIAAAGHTRAVGTAWATSTHIRKDVLQAVKDVTDEKRGDVPDTLVINPSSLIDLMASSEIQQVYVGNVADQNPMISGKVSFKFAGLDIWQSYTIPTGQGLVVQRKKFGGYADARPLGATPMYQHQPTETWRSDVTRRSAVFIDQPLCSTLLTGI
jgi:hypothetical protein